MQMDLDWLAEQNLSPDEYIFMLLKHRKWSFEGKLKVRPDLKKLEALGLVKNTGTEVIVRQEFIDLVEGDFDRMFAELCSTYPMKVGEPGGYRVLHAADPSAKANDIARKRYKRAIGDDVGKHKKVMKALNAMLTHQRGNLKYLQMLEVWVNSHGWEKWMDVEEKEEDDGRINRVL